MNPRLKTHALDHFMLHWKYYFSTTKGSLENKSQKYEVWTLFVTFLFINSNITGIYFIILSSLFFLKWSYQSSPQVSVTVTSEFGCSFIRNRNTSQSPFLLPALSCCSQMLFTCFSSIILYFVLFGKLIFESLRSFEQNFNKYNILKTANTNIAGIIALKSVRSFMHVSHRNQRHELKSMGKETIDRLIYGFFKSSSCSSWLQLLNAYRWAIMGFPVCRWSFNYSRSASAHTDPGPASSTWIQTSAQADLRSVWGDEKQFYVKLY